jgi:hypothetical protein
LDISSYLWLVYACRFIVVIIIIKTYLYNHLLLMEQLIEKVSEKCTYIYIYIYAHHLWSFSKTPFGNSGAVCDELRGSYAYTLDLPSILTTRPVALVLVELKHAVCRQCAEHVVLDESRFDLYSLSPMSMYRTTIRVQGARKKSTDDSSNAYGSLLARPHVDNSGMVMPFWSCPYTSPIWIALGIRERKKIKKLKQKLHSLITVARIGSEESRRNIM